MFSVIIPTFNASSTLESTLVSIASQTYKNYEVILIDALSTDTTGKIARGYAEKINLYWVSEKDNGIYDAMNKGIQAAKGEWLYFMGSDDVLFNNKVFENIAQENETGDEIIYGNVTWVPSGKREEGECGYYRFLKGNINHQRMFYHKSLFKKYGAFNTLYPVASDHELNIRFLCNDSIKKKYVDIDVAFFNETGFSANKTDQAFWENWKETVLRHFSFHLPSRVIYRSLGWYCWYNIRQKNYRKAFGLFWYVFLHTGDLAFIKHTLSQVSKAARH